MPTLGEYHRPHRDRYAMMFVYNLMLLAQTGASGVVGVAVQSVQDYYDIDNIYYNAIYFGSSAGYLLAAPIWFYTTTRFNNRYNFIACTSLSTAGYLLQFGYRTNFWFVAVGGFLSSCSNAMFTTTNNVFVAAWFRPEHKTFAFASIYFTSAVGSLVALLIGRLAFNSATDFYNLYLYVLVAYTAISVASVILSVVYLLEEPPFGRTASPKTPERNRPRFSFNLSMGSPNRAQTILFIVLYVWTTFATWSIQTLLVELMTVQGYSSTNILIAALAYSIGSLLAPLPVGYALGESGWFREIIFAVLILTAGVYGAWLMTVNNVTAFLMMTGFLGFLNGPTSTMFIETVVELAFPMSDRKIPLLMVWTATIGNLGGIALASFDLTRSAAKLSFLCVYASGALLAAGSLAFPVKLHRRIEFRKSYKRFQQKRAAKQELVQLARPISDVKEQEAEEDDDKVNEDDTVPMTEPPWPPRPVGHSGSQPLGSVLRQES